VTVIRPIALAIPPRGDDLLVFEYRDWSKAETFCRPLGGSEFEAEDVA
jgi:hypothetical protein